ncbi:IS3 family transposase [Deinococcus psychrotolerans]|uniref:IS3 family transposase n=1 Tax=Deinococcus psychrotolerans TaxID=2489213 RepID=UPI003B96999D
MLGFWHPTQRHHRDSPREEKELALKTRLRELAEQCPFLGYRRLQVLLKREGQVVNHKRVYRIYRAEGLAVRRKARKKITARERAQKP